MFSEGLCELLGDPPRPYGSETRPFHARALQFWPECAEIMLRVVDFQTRRVRIMACKSAIELFEFDKLGTLRYLLRGGEQRLDLVLSEAVVNPLARLIS